MKAGDVLEVIDPRTFRAMLDQAVATNSASRGRGSGRFRARRRPFRISPDSQPYLLLAAIVAVYIILGMLYESYIHPVTIL